MADQVEKVTEQQTQDAAGRVTTTRAVSSDTQERQVNKVNQVIWFIFGVLTAFLLLRIVLSLMGANEANSFASFIYGITAPFVAPFRGLLQVGEFQRGVSRFEVETLVAVIVYLLLAWGITAGVNLAKKNPDV